MASAGASLRGPRGGMGLSRGNVCALASPKQVSATNEQITFIHVEDLTEASLFYRCCKEIENSGFSIVNEAR
jgi:hypothetical protein